MIRRNQTKNLRYFKPNKHLHPKKFAYHLFLRSYSFVNESDLLSNGRTYSGKFHETTVCATVNENKNILY